MRYLCLASLPMMLLATRVSLASEQQPGGRPEVASSGWSLTTIVCATLALAVSVALIYAIRQFLQWRALRSKNDPRQLLHELCQAHGLSRRAEQLFRKAAAAVGTPHPARFFLEPQLLQQAANREELKANRLALGLLYERLFGENVA
ncbi:MAG: hypothetical protein ACKVP0_13155 [Pirellulaceae bacterium]